MKYIAFRNEAVRTIGERHTFERLFDHLLDHTGLGSVDGGEGLYTIYIETRHTKHTINAITTYFPQWSKA